MGKCAECFNCKVVGTTTARIANYNYKTLLTRCGHFHKNKKPHVLYHLNKNKTYDNCPHFVGMEDGKEEI